MGKGRHIAARWSVIPLPLMQLVQASQCAKTAPERFFFARQLWEATIQFLGTVCLMSWSQHPTDTFALPGAFLSSCLEPEEPASSSRQTHSAHWWRWVRLLLPGLSNSNDPFALRLREWLYSDCSLTDSCWLSDLSQLFGLATASACPRTPAGWFEHYILSTPTVAAFESGQHSIQEWNSKAQALVHALTDLLIPGSLFTHARLVLLSRVEQEGQTNYRLQRLELSGKAPRWVPPLVITCAEETTLPTPGQLYLELFPSSLDTKALLNRPHSRREHETHWSALCLHPLILYEFESEELFFLQSLYGQNEVVFVAPTTGRVYVKASVSEAVSRIVDKLVHHPATTELAKKWLVALNSKAAQSAVSHGTTSGHPTRFELLSELPGGPEAVQYRAWQLSMRRPVRLQCLIQTEKRSSFAEEELATLHGLVRLYHPNLIKVYEHGISEEMAFIATELVPGVSLASVMEKLQPRQRQSLPTWSDWQHAVRLAWQDESRRERPLCDLHTYERRLARYLAALHWPEPSSDNSDTASGQRQYVRNILELVSQIAEAVQSLHKSGLVHSSITPGRILLAYEDARPVLLEPSCSWDLSGNSDLAQSLRFLSSERRFGSPRLPPQADIYSLAAITLELLTLSAETVTGPDYVNYVRWAEQLALPRELIILLRQCVSPNPEERPDDAREFAQQLREFARQLAPCPSSTDAVTSPSPAKETTPHPDALPAIATSPNGVSVAIRQARQAPRRAHRLAAGFAVLSVTALLAVAAFCMLAWWVGLQPLQLFRLLVDRSRENWLANTERVSLASSQSSSNVSSPGSAAGHTAAISTATSPSENTEIIERFQKQLQEERHRADELDVELQKQRDLVAQQNARIQQLEKLLASASQDNKQHQPNPEQDQQPPQSGESKPTKPNPEVQASQLAEIKRLQEELAALTLKLETIATENQSLRQAQERMSDISAEHIYQWLQATNQSAFRHPLARRIRRPYQLLLRDSLARHLKNLDSKETPPLILAGVYLKLGLLEHDLGAYEAAQIAYQHAFRILNGLAAGDRQSAEYTMLLYSVHQATARLFFEQKKYPEAEAAWLQALSCAERCCGAGNQPERWLVELACCHEQLGTLYRSSRQLDKAESAYRNAVRFLEKLHQQRHEEEAYVLELARCYQGLAYLAELRDQVEVAEQNYQQAISLLEGSTHHQPHGREATLALAQLLAERAALYRDSGQLEMSLPWFQRALELLRPPTTSSPDSLDGLLVLRDTYAGRAHALTLLKRYTEALSDWEEAICCDCERLPTLRAYRAICLARLGNTERAAHEAKRLSQEQPVTGSLLYNLACVHAVLSETLAKESNAASPDSDRQREAHASRAIELLHKAADLGYFRNPNRLDYLQYEPDLDSLRHLDEFKRLLQKLSSKE